MSTTGIRTGYLWIMGQTSYRCNNKHGAGPEHSQQAVLFICCPTLVTALTAFTSLRPIIWQHQAGSATNLYSSGTQPVSLPHFRRSRFASWPALVHPGTVLMPRQDCVNSQSLSSNVDILNHLVHSRPSTTATSCAPLGSSTTADSKPLQDRRTDRQTLC